MIKRSIFGQWGKICLTAVLAINIFLGTLHIFRSDLFYETDIARDMLLLDDMVINKRLALIGGRTSMSGVFHGPLYYYLVLPIFAMSGGSPVAVSYVWLIMYWLFLGGFYYVGKKMFGDRVALFSTALMSSLTVFQPTGLTHTVLANFLIAPFIYLAYQYLRTNKVRWLVAAVFTCGLLIQFQMAFGVPVLLLVGSYTIYHIVKKKNYAHLLAGLVILIPLSTFILFDLRHDFLQTKSAIAYLTEGGDGVSNDGYWYARLISITEAFRVWRIQPEIIWKISSFAVIGCLFTLLYQTLKSKKNESGIAILLSLLVIFGFWVVLAPHGDNIWPQYYSTLLPLIVFCLTYFLLHYIDAKVGETIISVIIACNFLVSLQLGFDYWRSTPVSDEIHWKFYRQMASDIFVDSDNQEFGYYVFTPDQYGYQAKYALRYFAKQAGIPTSPYQKRALTYLIIAPNNRSNPWANEDYWQTNQVMINREPDSTWTYSVPDAINYTIRRFDLIDEEATISADPNLLDGIHFR